MSGISTPWEQLKLKPMKTLVGGLLEDWDSFSSWNTSSVKIDCMTKFILPSALEGKENLCFPWNNWILPRLENWKSYESSTFYNLSWPSLVVIKQCLNSHYVIFWINQQCSKMPKLGNAVPNCSYTRKLNKCSYFDCNERSVPAASYMLQLGTLNRRFLTCLLDQFTKTS